MDLVREFFSANYAVVLFAYGLVFFLMGFAIYVRIRVPVELKLARSLGLLALFGLLHGFADWGNVFIPIQMNYLPSKVVMVLSALHAVLTALSFAVLLAFGLRLLTDSERANRRVRLIPAVLYGIWLIWFVSAPLLVPEWEFSAWLAAAEAAARYFLALPASIVAAYALTKQGAELDRFGLGHLVRYLDWGVFAFAVYAVGAGVFTAPAPFWPANAVNENAFFTLTGLPIQVLRGTAGAILAYSVVRILEIFDIEAVRQIEIAESARTLLEERARIARDLHDGVIQSLYAVGLSAETADMLLDQDVSKARVHLRAASGGLARAVNDLRAYITNLDAPPTNSRSLREQLTEVVESWRQEFSGRIELSLKQSPFRVRPWPRLAADDMHNLVQLLREAVANAIRHSRAGEIKIAVVLGPGSLSVTVKDDGAGFRPPSDLTTAAQGPGAGRGLTNMAERARLLGGTLTIRSAPGRGTRVGLRMPLRLGRRGGDTLS